MLESAFAAGIRARWGVADEVYGNDGKFWWWLEQYHQQSYLLTVASSHSVFIGYQEHRVKEIAQGLPNDQWQRLSCGDGSKGERIYDWARIAVNCSNEHGMKRWILLRRNIERPDDPLSIAYYQVYAPADTTLEEMVLIAGQRWRVEECFEIAKDKLVLGGLN
jgi:SRSO17 transposase